jgi:hypothetical protein
MLHLYNDNKRRKRETYGHADIDATQTLTNVEPTGESRSWSSRREEGHAGLRQCGPRAPGAEAVSGQNRIFTYLNIYLFWKAYKGSCPMPERMDEVPTDETQR